MNLSANSSQVVMEWLGSHSSQSSAFPLSENGKSLNRRASSNTSAGAIRYGGKEMG
uniref:Uncharacterized protein LOC104219915 n=1 Tax=Nicotiana sylvestris TaxID=4096 RepID=A0A1U7VVK7_NICSY|nr:PREDICTED: uncharacterized protein LOC104219915 [Nicotiana sylvestris]